MFPMHRDIEPQICQAHGRNTQASGDGRITCKASGFCRFAEDGFVKASTPCDIDLAKEHMLQAPCIVYL